MSATLRVAIAAVVSSSLLASCRAEDQPTKSWVWLRSQGVWGFGYQIKEGPFKGLWRIDPDSKRAPNEVIPGVDPYGFSAYLNYYRAAAGLPPLAYDSDLTAWASQNNLAQAGQGIGHHIVPNCSQNCAWNTPDAASTADEWMRSRGHRKNMLDSSVTRYGIAFGPGPYWTMNAR
jgi:Cysteine-rich secretory protein family